MDLNKAQQLITKLQALLDQNSGSRLEKDLMKSYTVQLYEAIVIDEGHETVLEPTPKPIEFQPAQPVYKAPDPVPQSTPVHIEEPAFEEEPVFIRLPDPPKPKTEWQETYVAPKPVEVPVYEEPVKQVFEEFEFKPATPVYEEPVSIPTPPPVPEPVHTPEPEGWSAPSPVYESVPDALLALFDPPTHGGHAVGNVMIQDIGESMGLNDRIFTLKDLFGGDKYLFDSTIDKLNQLGSFTEAKAHLLHGVAKQMNWADADRVKMAQEFIRIVRRRYPQNS